MTQPLFILGTGGHARDVAEIAHTCGWRPVFVTRDAAERERWSHADELVIESDVVERTSEAFALGIGENRARAAVAARLTPTLTFPSLIHPDTSLGRGQRAKIEAARGAVIFAGVRMSSNVAIGDFVTVNLNATLSHDVELGDFANLSPGANVVGNVRVETGAWIGVGAAVNQGDDDQKRVIGAWSIIGSGAVVIRDCEPNGVYVGAPARKIR